MTVELGIIEGYFGRAWSWPDREHVVRTLARAGYSFFHYAPKEDARLRRQWREPFHDDEMQQLATFADQCRSLKVRFGIGLTPFAAHLDFNAGIKRDLRMKLRQLVTLGLDDFVIMFDDMRGDIDDLALRQLGIIDACMSSCPAARTFVVPTYYSTDPILDRAFGVRPGQYLRDLGKGLPGTVAVYWTGEEVCSREYSPGHLDEVANELGRRVALWDNYPVNDGPRKSDFLNLRAFTGRPASIAQSITHHAINPLSQPWLGCVPALTLPEAYERQNHYCYGASFGAAAASILGDELAKMVISDLPILQDVGLSAMGDAKPQLLEKYKAVDHPAAAEIVAWLRGEYEICGETVRTQ